MSSYKCLSRFLLALGNFNTGLTCRLTADYGWRLARSSCFANIYANKCHTTPKVSGLMEFFDVKENWKKKNVKVGRSWKVEELRIKSNLDLHKLWFVLLKEKNMLLTLEHECNEKFEVMPNPERLDKVVESMNNLETVVRERNKAYYDLEVGQTGERPVVHDENSFGLPCKRKLREHYIEEKINKTHRNYLRENFRIMNYHDVRWFLERYREKKNKMKLARQRLQFKHVCGLLRRFDNVDEEAIKQEFPDVNIEEAKKHKDSRGPRVNPF